MDWGVRICGIGWRVKKAFSFTPENNFCRGKELDISRVIKVKVAIRGVVVSLNICSRILDAYLNIIP